jgi:ribulose 1,5-bisphosphate synthetase/thiazole synthase
MERRDFITRAALLGSALTLGMRCTGKLKTNDVNPGSPVTKEDLGKKFIVEPQRNVQIFTETDVLVIGGGPAGSAAAIAASRTGAQTWLIEKCNYPGGLWTGGLVLPLLSTHAVNKNKRKIQVMYGLGNEIWERLKQVGMSISDINPVIDPEAGKCILEEMLVESGVNIMYQTMATEVIMDGNILKGVIIENKSGRLAIISKVIIDCTGDGDLIKMAGEDFDNLKYNIGLVHRLGNIDKINKSAPGYTELPLGDPTPIPGVNWVNMHGDDDQDGTDALNLSKLQIKFRQEIWNNWKKIKETPGYSDVFILDVASQLGVRMSRILTGEYKLTLEDTMNYRQFKDVIGISGAWTTMLFKGKKVPADKRPLWQIPYRSLVPKKTDGLLVAGRCFCFEKELAEDTRVIGPCLITGQGAGVAAGMAVKERVRPRQISIKNLHKELLKQKVYLG